MPLMKTFSHQTGLRALPTPRAGGGWFRPKNSFQQQGLARAIVGAHKTRPALKQDELEFNSEHILVLQTLALLSTSRWGCKARDISISQGKISETGIPKYSVQIANECVFDCAASDIHVHCGQFASTEVMNPAEFRRLSFDDCLVNNGQPLKPHQLISFTYSNTFMYPLAFKSAKFIC
ncbi:unnamed protein product [Prunus armeniaca]|uniref:Uncharacterized protein n=1 Tax=Prunus armeniaca TaxID=36596 RepID=A0A6J5TH72_PRUAR|nr:unnamed protein product [Prunus armeniaca]